MITIIAEKPSVAREIASIVNANKREDGYLEGNGYFVTWAFGHLVELAMPESYGYTGFNKAHLPMLPSEFILQVKHNRTKDGYVPDDGVVKQISTIEQLFNKSKSIIVATDAGREGELIFRYIYDYLKCETPFSRLWISSLTEKAIREGLNNLKDGKDFDNLALSAKARSESDWKVGMNATQAITIASGGTLFSLGRVQTPTLAMICKRFLENQNFKPLPYWDIKIQTQKDDIKFHLISKDRIEEKSLVDPLIEKLKQNSKLNIDNVEKKEVNEQPPLLFDLTELQKQANIKLNLSADETLSIAQKLYESKLITYPRTGSRYISLDVYETLGELFDTLKNHPVFGNYVSNMSDYNKRSVDDSKVTDHHALLVTDVTPHGLNEKENAIYNMILARMIEAFSPKCVKDVTTILASCENVNFSTGGTIIKVFGWREVLKDANSNEEENADEENSSLPNVNTGDILDIENVVPLEKKTRPKPLLTEASLLALMETAGKELENEEEKDALKGVGIGTPATRASVIETLFSREYIKRVKKNLVPTEKGLVLYNIVADKLIADVAMTGKWETALSKIENGTIDVKVFSDEINKYSQHITQECLDANLASFADKLSVCPKCKKEAVKSFQKVTKCTLDNCDFVIFHAIAGKNLTDTQINALLTKGRTSLIKGFTGKKGKFDAMIVLDKDFKTTFEFDNSKPSSNNRRK